MKEIGSNPESLMPQLDVAAYLVQYEWLILGFIVLSVIVAGGVLPVLQRQLAIRTHIEPKGELEAGSGGSAALLTHLLKW